MKKVIEQINIKSFITKFLLVVPLIDLITSICVRYFSVSTTLGTLLKGLFLAILIVYIFVKYKFENRKASTIFIGALIIYEICYVLLNMQIKTSSILLLELKMSLKTLFGPIIAIGLYDIYKNEQFHIKNRYLSYIMIEYTLLIFVANLTGTSFNTYLGGKEGTIGWFYAGNDISNLLIGLFPLLYLHTIKNYNIVNMLFMFLASYILLFVGTKVALFGLILSLVFLLAFSIISYCFKKCIFELKKRFVVLGLLIVFISILLPFSPAIKNMGFQYNQNIGNSESVDVIDDMVFSGRSEFRNNSINYFIKSSDTNKWLGKGYFDPDGNEYKLVEIDFYDIFFNHGIIGFILIFSVYIYILLKILSLIFKNKMSDNFYLGIGSYILSLLLLFGISFYAGHIFLNPAVSLYLSVILINLYYKKYNPNSFKEKKNNKITFMALHLKYGGIEKFISTTSKMLSKDYDVEIVSVYKYPDDCIVKIDKSVKIKYLLKENQLPNKDKIMMCLKHKKIISLIKELAYSLKILTLKNIKMINYIKKCDSSIIISTRIEHNKILSEYGCNDSIKIATEHNYYSKKYSKKVLLSCNNINYFVVSTNDLKQYYQNLFSGSNTKVVKIPFALDNMPTASSKLNNYNLISVGRLSQEKGYTDLIDIFNIVSKSNSKFNLTIIGEGQEREKIENRIKKYKLESKVKLLGSKNSKEIQQQLLKSSLFLMTSHTESFGIVIIEAMSCGVPCILFDSAKGALELIKNNYNGYIIENRNKEKYAKKIINIFTNKDKLLEMGNNSKKNSMNFNVDEIKREWINILK